jgi:hypothetical protein
MVLLLLAAVPVLAKDQTLLGDVNDSTSIWGIDLKSSSVTGQPGLWLGGYSGKIMNDGALYVGSEGYVLLTPIDSPAGAPTPPVNSHIGLFYCGLTCEYNLNPSGLIHISGSVLGGLLYVKYVGEDYNLLEGSAALCFVVEPGVNVMMNVTDSLKAGVGVSYRWVSGLDIQGLTNADLSGLSVNLIFKFVEF